MAAMPTDQPDLIVVVEALNDLMRELMVGAISAVEVRMEVSITRVVEGVRASTVATEELAQAAVTKVDMSIKETTGEDIRAITSKATSRATSRVTNRVTTVLDLATSSNIREIPMLCLHQLRCRLRPMTRPRRLISPSQALVAVSRIRK